jgi:hypothetical protein
MTEAHVPPQGIGNRAPQHRRASWVTSPRGAGIDSYKPGGLSVFGLCFDCNNLTSGAADPAYIDFHNAVTRYWSPTMRRLLIEPTAVPAPVAPGLIARSVLVGMFAINDRLQDHFPVLARGLRDDDPDLRLPDELRLRIALMEGVRSRIGGPVGYMRVLNRRETYMPFADVWFPPLAWCLISARAGDPSLGPDITTEWGDATAWVRFSPGTIVDLRELVGALPVAPPPMFGTEDWVVLTGNGMVALEGQRAG